MSVMKPEDDKRIGEALGEAIAKGPYSHDPIRIVPEERSVPQYGNDAAAHAALRAAGIPATASVAHGIGRLAAERDSAQAVVSEAMSAILGSGLTLGGTPLERVKMLVSVAIEATEKADAAERTVAQLRAELRTMGENHDAAVAEIEAAGRVLSDARIDDAETLVERIKALIARDNDRLDVVLRDRDNGENRSRVVGDALAKMRAERDELSETVDKLTAENARLAAQLEVAERIMVAALRGAK